MSYFTSFFKPREREIYIGWMQSWVSVILIGWVQIIIFYEFGCLGGFFFEQLEIGKASDVSSKPFTIWSLCVFKYSIKGKTVYDYLELTNFTSKACCVRSVILSEFLVSCLAAKSFKFFLTKCWKLPSIPKSCYPSFQFLRY